MSIFSYGLYVGSIMIAILIGVAVGFAAFIRFYERGEDK
jgi:hypothetical protein